MSRTDFRSIAATLFKGLLFGIGFMLVVTTGLLLIAAEFDQPLKVVITDAETTVGIDFREDLQITGHLYLRERRSKNQLQILCKLKNNGTLAWTDIEVQAELFYKGQYVDECHEFVRVLMPGEEDNMKIVCGDCALNTLPEYDDIKLKVAGAHRE